MMKTERWVFLGVLAVFFVLAVWGLLGLRSAPRTPSLEETNPSTFSPALDAAAVMLVQGKLLEAKSMYQKILETPPDAQTASAAQEKLGDTNVKVILSPTMTPDALVYLVEQGDTLAKIARKHNTTVELIKASNGLTSDLIRIGQRLKVIQANFSVIVDKSQNTLTLKNQEEVVKVYRCATGKSGITPTGTFRIKNRLVDPPWYTPNGVIPPGDPRNVLGSRWLGFDLPSYGIHGTIDPQTIGQAVTEGCVRLTNLDVEELYTLLPAETSVTIVE